VVSKLPPPREPRREAFDRGEARPNPGAKDNRVEQPNRVPVANDNRGRDNERRPDHTGAQSDAGPARVDSASRLPATVPRPPVRTRTVTADQPGSDRAVRHDVPRPPDHGATVKEANNRPATPPAANQPADARRVSDRGTTNNNVPRPTGTVQPDNKPQRQIEDRSVPRPQGNVRQEAPARTAHTDVQQVRRTSPDSGRTASRSSDVRRVSRTTQHQSAPAKSSGMSESHSSAHSAPAAKNESGKGN
jgi:hypothetical protein